MPQNTTTWLVNRRVSWPDKKLNARKELRMLQKFCKLCSRIPKFSLVHRRLSNSRFFLSISEFLEKQSIKTRSNKKNSFVNKSPSTIPSTGYPSGTSTTQTSANEKSPNVTKHNFFPFSWPETFDSILMALLRKKDLGFTQNKRPCMEEKLKHTIAENRKQEILPIENSYKYCINNLQVTGGAFFDGRLVIPACLRTIILQRLHEAHFGQFSMKSLATPYIWWHKIFCEILVHRENWIECEKAGKNLTLLNKSWDLGKLPLVV